MNIEREKFLTETMGEKWFCHEKSCGIEYKSNGETEWIKTTATTNNFSRWDDFGKLFQWSQKQVWWIFFVDTHMAESTADEMCIWDKCIINPDRFANAVYEFLKEIK